ncbi:acyl-CoA-binding domain-containing protein 4-like [Phragmites australis]|uniref:acyl-CoA-binding domain-containing protein 4-like n=1 Tax=Phragmites australis TaxID=29695 RepID=UPI002D7A04F2|nr:acyl-CoA-binding domain-containing protein 4-like [Phragmites australis]
MAGDWQDLAQASAIGLLFAFLVAKLISIVIAFKEDNLRITRSPPASPTAASSRSPARPATPAPGAPEPPSRDVHSDESSDDSDWEGVESTELDEEFSAASAFVAASAASDTSVPEEAQLRLYGLYKIATEGPCTAPQPSALKLKARAKWNAWHKLGAMPTEEAMLEYITIVNELFPNWAVGSSTKRKDEHSIASASGSKGPMGPVFSSLMYEEEDQGNESELGDIHVSAREGATDDIVKHLVAGVDVNMRDSEGRTPLHWAADRGHLKAVEILANANADLNAKDNEGQTALHYAVLCEREDIAELLVKHHADLQIKDEDGSTPQDLCPSSWSFMNQSN